MRRVAAGIGCIGAADRWPSFSGNSRYMAVITVASGGTLVVTPNPL